jgi:CheY-like chemotaxis protein
VPKATILLVDDSKTMRHVLRTHLMGMDWEFFDAESGRAALDVLAAHRVEVVISDVRMADIDGLELIREIRQREKPGEHIAAILISSDHSPEMRARGFLAGADAFVAKPVDPQRLKAIVSDLLAGR